MLFIQWRIIAALFLDAIIRTHVCIHWAACDSSFHIQSAPQGEQTEKSFAETAISDKLSGALSRFRSGESPVLSGGESLQRIIRNV